MVTRLARLVAVLAVAAALLVAPPPVVAHACSCAGGELREDVARADAVFTGELVSRTVTHPDGWWAGAVALDVFSVSEVHRGVVHERQGVVSRGPGSGCGLELQEGESYVVFASAEPDAVELAPGQVQSGPCSGTGPWPDERWAGLEEAVGAAPKPPRPGAAGTSPDLLPWGAARVAAGALLLVGGWVLLRRVRRRGRRGHQR